MKKYILNDNLIKIENSVNQFLDKQKKIFSKLDNKNKGIHLFQIRVSEV